MTCCFLTMGSKPDDLTVDLYAGRIYRHLQKDREVDNSKLWRKEVEKLQCLRYEDQSRCLSNAMVVKPPKNPPPIPKTKKKATFTFSYSSDDDDDEEEIVNLDIIPIKEIKRQPPMIYWTEIDSNIRLKEAPRFNVGHGNDIDSDEDPDVQDFITASVDSSCHPTSSQVTFDDTLEDDQLFISLVTLLLRHEKTGLEEKLKYILSKNIELPSLSSLDLKKSSVFNVIQRIFPKSPFPFVLRDRYLALVRARIPMLEGEEGIMAIKSTPKREEVLRPYHKLFCRRCYVYNCLIHGEDEKIGPEYCLSYPVLKRTRKNPCSQSCFMNVRSSRGHDDTWTNEEIEMYLTLYNVYPDNWCLLTKIIQTKDCSQVYSFHQRSSNGQSQEEHEELLAQDSEVILSLKDVRKATKSRTVKTWFNHCMKNDLLLSRDPARRPNRFPVYKPCKHEGLPCTSEEAQCTCLRNRINCEKYCGCVNEFGDCENLFPGCNCKGSGGRCDTRRCACYCANRECDIDICGCGIQSDRTSPTLPCKNVSILDKSAKKIYYAKSKVAGYGLFAGENLKKDEFIDEYIGEIISNEESERRSIANDMNDHTYFFTKDKEQILDGKSFGNLLRFINSSANPNTYPVIKTVRGDLRIGLYAFKSIRKGEELFFNYEKALRIQQQKSQQHSSNIQRVAAKYVEKLPIKLSPLPEKVEVEHSYAVNQTENILKRKSISPIESVPLVRRRWKQTAKKSVPKTLPCKRVLISVSDSDSESDW